MGKKKKQKPKRRRHSRIWDLIKAAVVVAFIGLVLRIFVFMPYIAKSSSMEDALYAGDYLLTSKLAYHSDNPQTGDLIVFEHPFKVGELVAGRVAAGEGHTVQIVDKILYVDDQAAGDFVNVKHTDDRILPPGYSNRDNLDPIEVPSGTVYVLSDNRDNGEDSRNFGLVSLDKIAGKGLFVYWSWKPDPNAPKMESPYITPAISILFYNLFHFPSRIGWDRIGANAE